MKVLRLEIPRDALSDLGVGDLLEGLEYVEILDAYQYDQQHFFSIQRIKFDHPVEDLEKKAKEQFHATFFQLLHAMSPQHHSGRETSGQEIVCVMKQTRDAGFWPVLEAGPWAFLFPLVVDRQAARLNLVANEEVVPRLFEFLDEHAGGGERGYRLLGSTNVDSVGKLDSELDALSVRQLRFPMPEFTRKQKEVASYAAQMGYFEEPKRVTAGEIAEHFGISESAVNRHLRRASNAAMRYFFGTFRP
ncbi:MAG: hypothetical protein Kow0069_06230 [Promethearchaeota archaeon]